MKIFNNWIFGDVMLYTVGVIGAGAMGTAISQIISPNCEKVYLYARREEVCNDINNFHYNSQYYPNIKLNENIRAINNLEELNSSDVIFLCIPSSTVREITQDLNKIVSENCIFVCTAKGIDKTNEKRLSVIIEENIGRPAVVLSGPNIASEMVRNYYTATTIAGKNNEDLKIVYDVLKSNKFKVNVNHDVIGTELCGIIKNVIAISQGICEGMNINDNARFAVFTKSYNETKEFISKLGGYSETVDDYCGFGDIITASTLDVSRNHTFGVLYGQKIIVDENATGVLFEGKNTTRLMKKICKELDFDFLTVNFVYDVIIKKINPNVAFNEFWEKI